MNDIQFGRIELVDNRDRLYPASTLFASMPPPLVKTKMWWADGGWFNQGNTSQCTAYAFAHWLEDGPVIQDAIQQSPIYNLTDLYHLFQANDGIPGRYEGSTIRAGAKVLKQLGFINEYRWAESLDDVIKAILMLGPVVVGTMWYANMMTPDSRGVIQPNGRNAGGHAYVLNGVDINKEQFRIKNSWGKSWGKDGHAFISFRDFEKLLKDRGEVLVALEQKLTETPPLSSVISDDVV